MRTFLSYLPVLLLFFALKISGQCGADFSYTTSYPFLTLQFHAVQTDDLDSTTIYSWTFGDGTHAYTPSPIHTFDDTGWFNVCLHTYVGSDSCATDTCILVHLGACQAYFTTLYDPLYTQPELDNYFFSDSSYGEDSSTHYYWSISLGDFSSNKNLGYSFDIDDSTLQIVCLTITNSDNGCISTYCDSINLNPLCPMITFTYTRQGNVYTFHPSGCFSYTSLTWNFGDGTIETVQSDSIVHTYLPSSDTFNVCLTAVYQSVCAFSIPCTAIECQQLQTAYTNLNEASLQTAALNISPSPAIDHITISTNYLIRNSLIQIMDISGREVARLQSSEISMPIDVSSLAAAIYFLVITDNAGTAIAKFVKQ